MRLAVLMPGKSDLEWMGEMQERIYEMRPDQLKHMEHLLRSWEIFGRVGGLSLIWRAIKRTLRDKP